MQSVGEKIKNLNLQWKLLIPIITVIVVLMSALGIYNISQFRDMLLDVEQQNMRGMVDDVSESLQMAEFGYEMLEQEGDENNLALARAVADLVANDPSYLEQENMEQLANRLGVDEFYVTDEEGVIQYGNDPDVIGLDFSDGEQTRPFLEIIEDPEMELAQEPMQREADDQLFQYVGVARQDQAGIVQVGMSGETLQEMESIMDEQIDQLITEAEIGEGGYMFVMDSTGEIQYHPDDPLIGRQHPDDELQEYIFENESGEITREVNGVEEFTVFEQWEDMYVAATIDTDEFLAPVNNLRTQLFGVLTFMLILILAIIVFVIRKAVIVPVREIQTKITSLGEGDLNAKISRDSNDEIGTIGQSFNKAVANIRSMIDTITNQTDKLNNSSEELASSVEETSASVQEVSKTMEDLANGSSQQSEEANNSKEKLDELSKLITETVNYSDSVAENSGQIKEVTQRSKDSLGELKSNYNKTAEIITSINNKVSDLNQSSEQIGEIVDQIKSVAEQTNLLALNASIEAARAGEHGQGFSVVANEIRKLAEETSDSMGDIEEITTKIREKIAEANNETEQSQPLAKKVEEATEEVENSFDENIETLEGITKQIDELAQNIRSVDEHKDEVVESISNIASITQESSAATQEVSASVEEQSSTLDQLASLSEQLNQIAHELHDQVKIFDR